ncbi:hypothetical protein PHPALM_30649 [Phytophthora palmivora]|uniref:PiggyBac transposable element-derived protein domain-containing protein n=1 Tax=Phytophthora palmivora TaxID=4796 RepID=A0A2P4X4M6_9STRA|nr:hypothetical protein PHPALM_30649 [Phytophthora palmivora]
MSFDEAMLPSRSSFNRMRVYMKDKPHKWGTKLFMLCCSQSDYCMRYMLLTSLACMYRFEVYCGKRQTDGAAGASDTKCEPAAVIRNSREVFGTAGSRDKRLIVTDRFYTSPTLAMQLLTLGFYSIGTVMTNRGTFTVADNKLISIIRAVCWWDNRPVHLLAAGGSVEQDRVKNGEQAELACPRVLKDYQTFMGGVDRARSTPTTKLALKYKKYYKSLFLGFLDLAIINPYIVYNTRREADGHTKLTHVKFLKQLHLEFIQLQERDWGALQRMQATSTKSCDTIRQSYHVPVQVDEWRAGKQGRKRRQRACKVCSVLKESSEAKGGETMFYCSTYKLHSNSKKATVTRVYLCNKVKHTSNGETVSCFEIWHRHWPNGSMLSPSQRKKKIRARTTELSVDEETTLGSDSDGGDDVDNQSKRRRRDE